MLAAMSKLHPLPVLLIAALTLLTVSDTLAQKAGADLGPLPVSKADPSWGSASAPVTVVVFSDFQCPFCARLADTFEELKKHYGASKLRIVHKHNPLDFHNKARPAAEASVAVWSLKGNDGFWSYASEAYQQLPGGSGGTPQGVLANLKLDAGSIQRLVGSGKPAKKVDADIELAGDVGVTGTPASFVNGVLLTGARPKDDFIKAIDEQLAAAAELKKNGTPARQLSLALTKKNFVQPSKRPAPSRAAAAPNPDDEGVWKVPVDRSPALGPANALVTLVLFSEFQCPFCKRIGPTIEALRTKYGNDLRVVFKHSPLPFHNRAKPAAELAIEAYSRLGAAGFWKAHDKLFENQTALEDSDLELYAKDLGLSPALTIQAVRADKHDKVIQADLDLADDVMVRGTPHSFINGRRLTGAQPVEKFEEIIDEEITHAKALVAKGIPQSRVYAEIIKDGKTAPPPEKKVVAAPTKDNPSRGGKYAKVTIQVFVDFQCPYCSRVQETLDELQKAYGNRLRIVFRHKPLPFHKDAPLAHQAAAEAFKQGGNTAFWKMHDRIFANQSALDRSTLVGYASEIGLDVAAFSAAIDGSAHQQAIDDDVAVSTKADINGTPSFSINGYFLSGAQPLKRFRKVVDLALKEAR